MKIYDGKYEFYEDERGMLMCKRNGEPWREFVGDKAVHGLFSHARDLEAALEKADEACGCAASFLRHGQAANIVRCAINNYDAARAKVKS